MLVPIGFLESVTEADLDAVISHEFAHMRRRDFLKTWCIGRCRYRWLPILCCG
jgi:Zn-dependent protease with chaperone function